MSPALVCSVAFLVDVGDDIDAAPARVVGRGVSQLVIGRGLILPCESDW
jgi:hypothetical protein